MVGIRSARRRLGRRHPVPRFPRPGAEPRGAKNCRRRRSFGGRGVLGKVGDYFLANDKIRVVIDDIGKRQGFAESGGNIIDAARRDRNIDLLTQLITYFDNSFPARRSTTGLKSSRMAATDVKREFAFPASR